MRSREEWTAHPHGIAVAKLPLLDIVKIGEAPPRPLPKSDRPLGGVRVLDLTRVLAGPTSGRVLAENGAEVLHIAAPHLPYQTEILMDTGHGKRCAWIDLREPAGIDDAEGLVREADVFTQGYRPGTLAARGFSPERVAELRPGIVCVSICAYGHEGPWSSRRGFDLIVQNVTGLAADARHARPAAQPAGPGARLYRGLSRRARRHGRARPPRRTGRLLAGPRLAGPGRPLDREPRHDRRRRRREGTARGGTRRPADGKRRPVRPSAPPEAGRAAQRDAGLLRPPRRTARLLAGAVGLN